MCREEKTADHSSDGIKWNDGTEITEKEKFLKMVYSYFVMIRDDLQPIPMKISLGSFSGHGAAGESLYNMFGRFVSKGEPIFLRSYVLTSVIKEHNGNQFNISHAKLGERLSEEEFNQVAPVFDMYKKVTTKDLKPEPKETEGTEEAKSTDPDEKPIKLD